MIKLVLMLSCVNPSSHKTMQPQQIHALRLKPGQDLKQSIQDFVQTHHIQAGWVITCVGSLTQYNIRFANADSGVVGKGHFEIINLSGTLSVNGSHLHIGIADSTGKSIGGHLLDGCKVYTTAELIIGESKQLVFTRAEDGSTPWKELQIKQKP